MLAKKYEAGQEYRDVDVDPEKTHQEKQISPGHDDDAEVNWYIVALEDGCCDVMSVSEGQQLEHDSSPHRKVWGPFQSYEGAIARRIGLIRAGKCKPY
ncbi:MAG: hypothetical protein AAGA67_04510 [Cyanobacteria bacterium P01_F01_bin.153]